MNPGIEAQRSGQPLLVELDAGAETGPEIPTGPALNLPTENNAMAIAVDVCVAARIVLWFRWIAPQAGAGDQFSLRRTAPTFTSFVPY